MGETLLEPFADVAAWTARRPDGQASIAISIALGGPARLAGRPTATIVADGSAAGHRLDRAGTARDLSARDDIELWVRGDRAADGSAEQPFFAEVRLGAAGNAPGSAGNPWSRAIPIQRPGRWELVPFALDDLPPAVRAAATTMRITAIGGGWRLDLDAIRAVRHEPLTDVDAGLRDRLTGRVVVDGTPVPLSFAPTATATAPPALRVSNVGFQPLTDQPTGTWRTDHQAQAFRTRPTGVRAEVTYAIEAVTPERAVATRMIDALLRDLLADPVLVVAGRAQTVDVTDSSSTATAPGSHPAVHLRVTTSFPRSAPPTRAVPPFNRVDVEVDDRASA